MVFPIIEMSSSTEELFENEWYIVRYSGEIPEIAYNSAIYYLKRSPQGPKLTLTQQQIDELKQAAVERYQEIILRDLDHGNVDKPIYRGISRSICNYQRYCSFCARQHLEPTGVKELAAQALKKFLKVERQRVGEEALPSVINCGFEELLDYAAELGVVFGDELNLLRTYCWEKLE